MWESNYYKKMRPFKTKLKNFKKNAYLIPSRRIVRFHKCPSEFSSIRVRVIRFTLQFEDETCTDSRWSSLLLKAFKENIQKWRFEVKKGSPFSSFFFGYDKGKDNKGSTKWLQIIYCYFSLTIDIKTIFPSHFPTKKNNNKKNKLSFDISSILEG